MHGPHTCQAGHQRACARAGGVVKAKDTRKMVIKFYANGVFTINDGPARDCDAPENQAFMQSIIRGECPTEINATEDTDVSLLKLGEDYTEPDKPKCAPTLYCPSAVGPCSRCPVCK